eukprot:3579146-Prymnesium_polylepis.1
MERVLLMFTRQQKPAKMKSISDDVDAIVKHLIAKCGSTWAQACVPSRASQLVNPPRSPKLWECVQRSVQNGTLR